MDNVALKWNSVSQIGSVAIVNDPLNPGYAFVIVSNIGEYSVEDIFNYVHCDFYDSRIDRNTDSYRSKVKYAKVTSSLISPYYTFSECTNLDILFKSSNKADVATYVRFCAISDGCYYGNLSIKVISSKDSRFLDKEGSSNPDQIGTIKAGYLFLEEEFNIKVTKRENKGLLLSEDGKYAPTGDKNNYNSPFIFGDTFNIYDCSFEVYNKDGVKEYIPQYVTGEEIPEPILVCGGFYKGKDKYQKYVENVDGAYIEFSLADTINPTYGLSGIDFESDNTYVALYRFSTTSKDTTDYWYYDYSNLNNLFNNFSSINGSLKTKETLGLIDSVQLGEAKSKYRYYLPNDLMNDGGVTQYLLVVSVAYKCDSDHSSDMFLYTDIYTEKNPSADIGFTGLEYQYYVTDRVLGENDSIVDKIVNKQEFIKQEDLNSSTIYIPRSCTYPQSDIYQSATSNKVKLHFSLDYTIAEDGKKQYEYLDNYYHVTGANEMISYVSPTVYVRFWDASTGSDEKTNMDNAPWQIITEFKSAKTVTIEVEYRSSPVSGFVDNQYGTYFFYNNEEGFNNSFKYQFKYENGNLSDAKEVTLKAYESNPVFDVSYSNDGSSSVPSTDLVIKLSDNKVFCNTQFYIIDKNHNTTEIIDYKTTITSNGSYYIYGITEYDEFYGMTVNVDWIDNRTPTIFVTDMSESTTQKHIMVEVNEDKNLDELVLEMQFSDEYANRLGINKNVIFNTSSTDPIGNVNNGIYHYDVIHDYLASTYDIYLYFLGDDSGLDELTENLVFVARDGAGNVSKETNINITYENKKYNGFVSSNLDNGNISLVFDLPVILEKTEDLEIGTYGDKKIDNSIEEDGEYEIFYRDAFGKDYKQKINVNAISIYKLRYTLKAIDPLTNDYVEISYTDKVSSQIKLIVEVDENVKISRMTTTYGYDFMSMISDQEAQGVVYNNCELSVFITSINGGDEVERKIIIDNIDTNPPKTSLYWYFNEWGKSFNSTPTPEMLPSLLTTKDVFVRVNGDEELIGINGSTTTHTFTYGSSNTYTFYVADKAGNAVNPITVTLPINIVNSQEADVTPPDYKVSVYTKTNNIYAKEFSYTSNVDTYSIIDKIKSLPKSKGLLLRFDITDINSVKIIALNGIQSGDDLTFDSSVESIDGLTIDGTNVYISNNGIYTLVLIDSMNNKSVLSINCSELFDFEEPTYTIERFENKQCVYLIFTLSDDSDVNNQNETIRFTSTSSNILYNDDLESNNYKKYVGIFNKNEDITFTIYDRLGNNTTGQVSISSFDERVYQIVEKKFTPCYVEDGAAFVDQIPYKTNQNVVANLTFNKEIDMDLIDLSVEVNGRFISNPMEKLEYVNISINNEILTLTVKENCEIYLEWFDAINNQVYEEELDFSNVIDRVCPDIIVSNNEPISGKTNEVLINFTCNQEEYYSLTIGSPNELHQINQTISYKITKNGEYSFDFKDVAGNTTTKIVNITKIDEDNPIITITNLPEVGFSTKENVTVKVSVNENAMIEFMGQKFDAIANTTYDLIVKYNGSFVVKATDEFGNFSSQIFKIIAIDNVSPEIDFETSILSIRQGTSLLDLQNYLNNGLLIKDNVSLENQLIVGITPQLTQDDLNTIGVYELCYTVTDLAGNTSSAIRYLNVFDKNEITVHVNGTLLQNGNSIFTYEKDINLLINNPIEGESYKIYYKAGINTFGQMKNSTLIEGNEINLNKGYYTILVISQSRVVFIARINVLD